MSLHSLHDLINRVQDELDELRREVQQLREAVAALQEPSPPTLLLSPQDGAVPTIIQVGPRTYRVDFGSGG